MSNYKIIFIDIDNTLNPTNGQVSPYTKKIMTELKNAGIIVAINTGRSTSYAIAKSNEANLSEYIISSNGAEIYNKETNKIIFQKNIPASTVKEIYKYCQEQKLTLILNSFTKRFINNKNYTYNNEPVIYFDDISTIISQNYINQLIILSDNYDRMLIIPRMFKEKFPNLKVVHSSKCLIEGYREPNKEYYHDLILENTSKSTGIVELLDYLKISKDEAIAIGDGYDDICICDVVKTSIAMGNANETLKKAATLVAPSVLEDGAAKILADLCLEKRK